MVRRIKSNKFKLLTVLLYNISNILGGMGWFLMSKFYDEAIKKLDYVVKDHYVI